MQVRNDWRHRSLWWHVLYVILLALVSYRAVDSGIFGYNETTAHASRDVFYRAWSVAYPNDDRARATVVLFSDDSLGGTGSWPPPYESHAALLRQLIALKPAAVMIDIGFVDPRPDPTLGNLIAVLKHYRAQGVPVFLAAASKATGANRPIRSELEQLAASGDVTLVSILTGTERGRLASYPLEADAGGFRPAARAIYERLCEGTQLENCHTKFGDKEFEVWWAAAPNSVNCRLVADEQREDCNQLSTSPVTRLVRLAAKSLAGDWKHLAPAEADPVPLPPPPIVAWEEVVLGTMSEEVRRSIPNSVVFYGLNLALIRDEIYSPVHGLTERRDVPGVFYHAMAYDNLVTLGDGRIALTHPLGLSPAMRTGVLVFLACLTSLLARIAFFAIGRPEFASWADWVLIPLVVLAAVAFEFVTYHVSPGNWIGVIFAQAPLKLADAAGLTDKVFAGIAYANRRWFRSGRGA